MSLNQPIRDLEKAKSIPEGTSYVATMGDGSGTKAVTQETLVEKTGKALKVGNLEELKTENKSSLVAAINEAAQSGGTGGGTSVDILDSKEEIEANTEAEKVAGALAVKEMIGELNDKLQTAETNAFRFEGGDTSVKVNSGNGAVTRINFSTPFEYPPLVFIQAMSGAGTISIFAKVITEKYFDAYGYYNGESTVSIKWIAVGK